MHPITDSPTYINYPNLETAANPERAIIPYVSTAEFIKKIAEKGLEENTQTKKRLHSPEA